MSNNQNSDWLVGFNPLLAVFESDPMRVQSILLYSASKSTVKDRERLTKVLTLAEQYGVSVERMAKDKFAKRFADSGVHQGVAAKVKPQKEQRDTELAKWLEKNVDEHTLILILDQVQDPHNFGAILRTAEAAGVNAVIVPNKNSAPTTAVVRKVASGAVETINLYRVNNLARAIEKLKSYGVWVVGTSDRAQQTLYTYDFKGAHALVLGSEGSGLRRLTGELCDSLISIPMGGAISSLNVSVAAGVTLFEVRRQRLYN